MKLSKFLTYRSHSFHEWGVEVKPKGSTLRGFFSRLGERFRNWSEGRKLRIFWRENASEFVQHREDSFNEAKKISDFIAFIVRVGFLKLASLYFHAGIDDESLITAIISAICYAGCSFLILLLMISVYDLLFLYIFGMFFTLQSSFWRGLAMALSFAIAVVIYIGIGDLTRSIADASAILSAP